MNLRLALEIPFKDGLLAPELKAATGSFGIVFPAGGTLDGEVSKRLSEAFALGREPLGAEFRVDFRSLPRRWTGWSRQAGLRLSSTAKPRETVSPVRCVSPRRAAKSPES